MPGLFSNTDNPRALVYDVYIPKPSVPKQAETCPGYRITTLQKRLGISLDDFAMYQDLRQKGAFGIPVAEE